jgi:HK97 family phage major capsid protein
MLSLQEIQSTAHAGIRNVRKALDASNGQNGWHPEDANIFDGLKASEEADIRETLSRFTLSTLLAKLNAKEILMKGVTADGADVLVATKLHDTLIYAAKEYDICDRLGYVVGPWEGGNLKVDITKDGSYKARRFVGGANIKDVNAAWVQNTLTPEGYGIKIAGGEELIEDEAYGIVQWHAEEAAKAVGKQATDLALSVLTTGTGGDGTLNSSATGNSAETKFSGGTTSDVVQAYRAVGADQFNANTLVCTSEAFGHSISLYTGTNAWHPLEPPEGFDAKIGVLDVLISNSPTLHAAADIEIDPASTFTLCKTAVFDRKNALMTGRKRWMEIKNFADPIRDIGGAVVSFRQASACLYNDAIYVLTETA